MKFQRLLCAALLFSFAVSVQALEVGKPINVASEAKDTLSQTWAAAAWSAESECWLVVWREGYINAEASDIWCARVSAEGKALDSEGVRLTEGAGVKDRPRVASDGKDFMVLWEDYRNGKDWDVYALRVSGKGAALDKDPILVAGGEHSQCRADIAFAPLGGSAQGKGNYHVVWMGFAAGKYDVYGTRLSSDGKIVSNQPVNVFPFTNKQKKAKSGGWPGAVENQGILPLIAANSNGDVFAACFVSRKHSKRYLAWSTVNPETGKPTGSPSPVPSYHSRKPAPGLLGWYRERAAALALSQDGAMIVSCANTRSKSKKDISVTRLSKTGKLLSLEELGSNLTQNNQFKPLRPRPAVAFDGTSYLAVTDCQSYIGKKKRPPSYRVKLVGWQISADGKVADDNGFLIAGDGNLDCLLPAVSAGPKGVSLVVYSEVRGVDNIKVLARVLR